MVLGVLYAMQGLITQTAEAIHRTTVCHVHQDNTQTKVQLHVARALSERITMEVIRILLHVHNAPVVKQLLQPGLQVPLPAYVPEGHI